ncbi:hypothetical protein ACTFSP_06145 [Bacillus cereus group sp. MYBK108-2]|nr:hypothetical protein [Bacillus cereus]MDA2307641.1 hypothetical protein [Bacillus cereus]HDX9634226.1 hypothetical protein [Bacillus cereus]HEF1897113.1 hypothetical protein [Bacillus cereus]
MNKFFSVLINLSLTTIYLSQSNHPNNSRQIDPIHPPAAINSFIATLDS